MKPQTWGISIPIDRDKMHAESWVEEKPPLWKKALYALILRKPPVRRWNMVEALEKGVAFSKAQRELYLDRVTSLFNRPPPDKW